MKNLFIFIIISSCLSSTYAQIGIKANNTAPIASAQLEVQSTTKAFYPPRMTTALRTTMPSPPLAGAMVFDTDLNGLFTFNGSSWVSGGLVLPYSVSQNELNSNLLRIENTNVNTAYSTIFGGTSSNEYNGINGIAYNTNPTGNPSAIKGVNISTNANGYGVYGEHSGTGSAIYGTSDNGFGVYGKTSSGTAVRGISNSVGLGGYGVYGEHIGAGSAVYGVSNGGEGVFGDSNSGIGVEGTSSSGIGGFFSSASGYALITRTGKVGIGTAIPASKMDIKGSAYLSHFYFGANEDTYIRGGKAGSDVLINDIAGQGNVGIGVADPAYILDVKDRIRLRANGSNTAGLYLNNAANTTWTAFAGMKTDNQVGLFIGGTWRFWVDNTGSGFLNGNLIQTSDKRLKQNFSSLNNSLSDIYQLKGYHFKWIEASRSHDLQTGLIAQEVQKIFPELVQTDEKGFLSVNYIGIIPHLIESVKELKDENISLKSRLDKIETLLTNSQLSANKMSNK